MSTLLVTPKEKGNTYDVVSYVKNNSDAELLVLGGLEETIKLKKYGTIIICTGVYGDNMHQNLRKWLLDLEKTSLHENAKLYVFLTWIGRGKSDKATLKKIKAVLNKNDIPLEDDYFTCFGNMLGIRNHHPNEEDCQNVMKWVNAKSS